MIIFLASDTQLTESCAGTAAEEPPSPPTPVELVVPGALSASSSDDVFEVHTPVTAEGLPD